MSQLKSSSRSFSVRPRWRQRSLPLLQQVQLKSFFALSSSNILLTVDRLWLWWLWWLWWIYRSILYTKHPCLQVMGTSKSMGFPIFFIRNMGIFWPSQVPHRGAEGQGFDWPHPGRVESESADGPGTSEEPRATGTTRARGALEAWLSEVNSTWKSIICT